MGVGHLALEIDGANADAVFSALSLDVYGIANPPVWSDSTRQDAIRNLSKQVKQQAQELVKIPHSYGCQVRARVVGEFVGEHNPDGRELMAAENDPLEAEEEALLQAALALPRHDFIMRMAIRCQQELKGASIEFRLSTFFPKVVKVKATMYDGVNLKATDIDADIGHLIP